jgi:DMSO/TMAO reductase YedYZ molybdopterin-dependent catalytic subunit
VSWSHNRRMNRRADRSDTRVGRRSLLEWLGGATVLALYSPLLQACRLEAQQVAAAGAAGGISGSGGAAGAAGASGQGGEPGMDASTDASTDAGGAGAAGEGGSCQEQPGTLTRPDLVNWNVRTVDPQDLANILATWTFSIGGMVKKPLKLGFCDLRDMGLLRQVTDFHCVEGWSVYDVPWDGIALSTLLDMAGPLDTAKYLKIHSVGGKYFEGLPIEVAREARSILALGVDGSTMPLDHGFPSRVVVPRLLGYKNPKFVDRIELVDTQPEAYWPGYGYTWTGEVPADRLRPGKY